MNNAQNKNTSLKSTDYIIDLGPDSDDGGGEVVTHDTP